MATQVERTVVNAAAVVQGVALVTFPAASTILTDPSEYDLSSTQYGTLFLPQVITAIAAALLGAGLGGRFGVKRVYLVGLAASLVSMALLLASSFVTDEQSLAFGLLLLATASLGAGFGFTVPALNTLTAAFNPSAVNRSILVLNALLAALLPLTISFGQEELTAYSAAVAGGVIAFYQLGYGIAAFGVGPLLDSGVELPTVYALAAVVAAVMGIWSFAVAGRRPSPASLHPQAG
jgi:MFS family permease